MTTFPRNRGLTPEQRADARLAIEMLDGTGLSLVDAARIAAGGQTVQQVPLSKAVALFLRECSAKNLRPRSIEFYELRLDHFCRTFDEQPLSSLDRPKLRAWLTDLPVADSTRQGYLRALRAFFRWCRRQEPPMIRTDPSEGLQLIRARSDRTIQFFTPNEAKKILNGESIYKPGQHPYKNAAALMLFAGIRPSEINAREKPPLLWKHIDMREQTIRIPAEIAKTRSARILEDLPANLWQWLRPGQPDDPICDRQVTLMGRWMRAHAGIERWHQDGCRHSFATYHMAAFGSAEKTSVLLGHEGRVSLLHQAYKGVVTRAEAERYFAILPKKTTTVFCR